MLRVVSFDEYWNVLHACCYESGEEPFSRGEFQCLFQNLFVDRESVAYNCPIIRPGQGPDKVGVELLKRVSVQIGYALCCQASAQSVLSALPEQGLYLLGAVFVDSRGPADIWDELLSFVKHEENVGFDFEGSFSPLEELAGQVDNELLYHVRVRDGYACQSRFFLDEFANAFD